MCQPSMQADKNETGDTYGPIPIGHFKTQRKEIDRGAVSVRGTCKKDKRTRRTGDGEDPSLGSICNRYTTTLAE